MALEKGVCKLPQCHQCKTVQYLCKGTCATVIYYPGIKRSRELRNKAQVTVHCGRHNADLTGTLPVTLQPERSFFSLIPQFIQIIRYYTLQCVRGKILALLILSSLVPPSHVKQPLTALRHGKSFYRKDSVDPLSARRPWITPISDKTPREGIVFPRQSIDWASRAWWISLTRIRYLVNLLC